MRKRNTKIVERPKPKFDPIFHEYPEEIIQDDRGRIIGEVYTAPPTYINCGRIHGKRK